MTIAMIDLYERLISVEVGKSTKEERIDAYLRALMVAAELKDHGAYERIKAIVNGSNAQA